jgi:hypothetical protein
VPRFSVGDFFTPWSSANGGGEVVLPPSLGEGAPTTTEEQVPPEVREKDVLPVGHVAVFSDPLVSLGDTLQSAQVTFAEAFDPTRFEANLQPMHV